MNGTKKINEINNNILKRHIFALIVGFFAISRDWLTGGAIDPRLRRWLSGCFAVLAHWLVWGCSSLTLGLSFAILWQPFGSFTNTGRRKTPWPETNRNNLFKHYLFKHSLFKLYLSRHHLFQHYLFYHCLLKHFFQSTIYLSTICLSTNCLSTTCSSTICCIITC